MRKIALPLALTAGFFLGCEDPDEFLEPRNPDLAIDIVVGTIGSATRLLQGCERQLALAYQEILPIAEIASDNYVNTQTFYNQFLDDLNVDFTDNDLNDTAFDIQRLRALANLGLEQIGPGDESYTANQNAEFFFFRGIAQLLAGSYFRTIPVETEGVLGTQDQLYRLAVDDFESGLELATADFTINSLRLARARALYQLGECDAASAAARELLDANPDFVRYVEYDAVNGPDNALQNALFDRGTFDDLQPLPRLDFLDPKYNNFNDPTADINTAYLKSEEAHLIIAEALLASGEVEEAQEQMKEILPLIATRPTSTFLDAAEQRTQSFPGTRPDTTSVVVAAGPGEDFREGLVLDRNEPGTSITVPIVSGTSVDSAYIDDLDGLEETLEALYLMRQEIFIAEGRRVIDLGIAFVPSENELLLNENVTEADVEPNLPSFIQENRMELDAFTYDAATGEVTIALNLNRILAENRNSEFVLPCF